MTTANLSGQPCIVRDFVVDKKRFAVQLVHESFKKKTVLVGEDKLQLDYYAAESISPFSDDVEVRNVGSVGNSLFTRKTFKEGDVIFEEQPLMAVRTEGDAAFASRWHAYWGTSMEQGKGSKVILAFDDLSDGGVVVKHLADATTLFKKMVNVQQPKAYDEMISKPDGKAFAKEEIKNIAGVLARWASNAHSHKPIGLDQSAVYRIIDKMQHSCEANCRTTLSQDTGSIVIRALRNIDAGDALCIDYMGHDPRFHAMGVVERRDVLKRRGFECVCSRCLRECAEVDTSAAQDAARCPEVVATSIGS